MMQRNKNLNLNFEKNFLVFLGTRRYSNNYGSDFRYIQYQQASKTIRFVQPV